jgi:replicative DNA helicase
MSDKVTSLLVERHCLAGALRHPEIVGDISLHVKEDDFKLPAHKIIFSTIIDAHQKEQPISRFIIAQKIQNAGITLNDVSSSTEDYLEHLSGIQINVEGSIESFKELRKTSVRRDLYTVGANLQKAAQDGGNLSIDEIVAKFDDIYSRGMSMFEVTDGQIFEDVFEDMEEYFEERGNNPSDQFGIVGPFQRTHELYGSLLRRGNVNLVAARTGVGKTQIGQYCMLDAMIKYKIPILHLDMGEMSKQELQARMLSTLSKGQVAPDMLEDGTWRRNPETERLVRSLWPEVRKYMSLYHYHDVSELSPDQIVSLCKRYYWSKAKPRNFRLDDGLEFIIFYDYLKAFESETQMNKEHAVLGHFMQKMKRLVKKQVPASIWTSLQVNRTGIVGNKQAGQIDDTENVFGLSDRIIQQVTHGWLLRELSNDEKLNEPYGATHKFINRKRRSLGKDRQAAINPVKMPDGSLKDNVIYLKSKNFVWEEVGDLLTLKDKVAPPHHTAAAKQEDGVDETDLD